MIGQAEKLNGYLSVYLDSTTSLKNMGNLKLKIVNKNRLSQLPFVFLYITGKGLTKLLKISTKKIPYHQEE